MNDVLFQTFNTDKNQILIVRFGIKQIQNDHRSLLEKLLFHN